VEKIIDKYIDIVKQQLNIVEDDILGLFLYGSQNYELSYDKSDYDFICVTSKNLKENFTLHSDVGQIKIYTLAYFIAKLRLGDLECYEILFTKYRYINKKYLDTFSSFVNTFAKCMNYEKLKKALVKKLEEHLTYLFFVNPQKEYGFYSKKRLYWLLRVRNQLDRLILGEDFKSSLVYPSVLQEKLLKIKTIDNYLSKSKLEEILSDNETFISNLPKFNNLTTQEEQLCLARFYNEIECERC
jgi:hypothetical protein